MKFYRTYTGPACFPPNVVVNGSFGTSGTTVTLANVSPGDLKQGDKIYSEALNELRKVTSIQSDTEVTIDSAFSSDVVAETPLQIADRDVIYKHANISTFGDDTGELDGEITAKQSVVEIDDDDVYFTIDATDTQMSILAID